MTNRGLWRWGLLAAVVVCGFLLRAYHISRIFLWLDEMDMFNEYVYGQHPKSLVDFALYTRDATTVTWGWPGLIWIVSHVFGATIGVARMPTMLVSSAGVLLLFVLIYQILPRDFRGNRFWPALFAAAFTAISIMQLEHAQRTYPYGAIPCVATLILLAHFQVMRAASPAWKYSPGLFRAIVVYTGAAALAFCIHNSLDLLFAISAGFLCYSAAPHLLRQSWPERWKVLRPAIGAGAIVVCAALLNAKNPKYGFRVYLENYYGTLSPRAIPKLLMHAYDLLTYHLNVVYNPSLYWPERLNPILLPLVALCLFGWVMAAIGKFGSRVRQLAAMAMAGVAIIAALSLVRIFPFGGVRQTLFLTPFFLTFAALGFYSLRGHMVTRVLGIGLACGYLILWGVNLQGFYSQREAVYAPADLVAAWEQSGRLPVYTRGSERELRYELRDHPEIQISTVTTDVKPPYLLITTHNWIRDHRWFGGFPEYLQKAGYTADIVKQGPVWNLATAWHSQSLYFPPNGLWIYKVTVQ
jgi:hypothetical protein